MLRPWQCCEVRHRVTAGFSSASTGFVEPVQVMKSSTTSTLQALKQENERLLAENERLRRELARERQVNRRLKILLRQTL